MPAGKEEAAPASARPWTGIGDVGQREEAWRLASSPSECMTAGRNGPSPGEARGMPACDEGAAAARARARPRTGVGHLRVRERRYQLARREQPQRERDHACIEAGTWPARDWNWDK